MTAIIAWLQGSRDFQQGLALYQQHLGETLLFRILSGSGATAFNRSKLEQALTEHASSPVPAAPKPAVFSNPVLPAKTEQTLGTTHTVTARLLMKERAHLHTSLSYEPDQEKRRVSCCRILDIGKELDVIYGKVPAPAAAVDPTLSDNISELIQARNNLRTRISKNKNKPHKQAEVAAWTEQRNAIAAKLQTLQSDGSK